MKNVEKPKTFSIYAEYRIGHRGVYFVSVGPSGLAIAGFAVRRNPQ